MCAADENKKAAENKIYKLSGFREQKLFYIFYFLPLSCGQFQVLNSILLFQVASFSHLRIQNLLTNTE